MSSLKNISEITTIILDVDGVLTDGRFGYHDNGDEIKFFHVWDGAMIRMAVRAGLRVGILSGRKSKANETRATELGMTFLKQACKNKADGLRELLKEQNLRPEECFYMGDDFIDIPPIRLCGMAGAPANARAEVKEFVDFVTEAKGGEGAVAEAIEIILKGQGKWEAQLQRYLQDYSL